MMDAWFDEFRQKDHFRDSLLVQQFFREHKPSLHLFCSADNMLPMTVVSYPSLAHPWIVQPTCRFELKECDVWHFETQV